MENQQDNIVASLLLEIELWALTNCQPFQQSWMAAVLAVLRYAPQTITFLLFFGGLRYREIYLLLFAFGLTLNSLLNLALNALIMTAPRVATCVPLHGATFSWQVQQTAFFVIFSIGFMALYRPRTKLWHIFILLLFYVATVVATHMLNNDFANAIVSGAVVGTLMAFLYQWFLYFIIVPTFPMLLKKPWVRYWDYRDTLCNCDTTPKHVVVLENLNMQFPYDQAMLQRDAVRDFIARQTY